ncbi:MAG: class I SAM-dependent methyltransferase [Flavobacteriales bacterium]|nr:class I SAM-dependent methyltransferase [Flavobacteriales bacterium]
MAETGLKCSICTAEVFTHLFNKSGFDILKCSKCQIVFTNIPQDFDLLSIYDESYFEGGQKDGYGNYSGTANVLRKEFRKSVTLLRKLTGHKSGLRLLELGSAYGFFLDEAATYFECLGIEVSQPAAQYAVKRGHHVINNSLNEKTQSEIGKVDIAVMFDVIEHLQDPVATLKLIDGCVNKNGIIILTTGNIGSFIARIFGKRWRLMTPPQHTFFFSRKTLCSIFENMNYEIEVLKRPWKLVPLGLVFYQLGNRLGFRIRVLEKLKAHLPINLFDTVMVVARKL